MTETQHLHESQAGGRDTPSGTAWKQGERGEKMSELKWRQKKKERRKGWSGGGAAAAGENRWWGAGAKE